jgi:hypothetical protein
MRANRCTFLTCLVSQIAAEQQHPPSLWIDGRVASTRKDPSRSQPRRRIPKAALARHRRTIRPSWQHRCTVRVCNRRRWPRRFPIASSRCRNRAVRRPERASRLVPLVCSLTVGNVHRDLCTKAALVTSFDSRQKIPVLIAAVALDPAGCGLIASERLSSLPVG